MIGGITMENPVKIVRERLPDEKTTKKKKFFCRRVRKLYVALDKSAIGENYDII